MEFLVRNMINKMWVMTLVQVVKCTNSGGLSSEGFVDVKPLISGIDANGEPVEHEVIHNLPYFRYHGGVNGIIMDPSVGDKGIAVFSHHDMSNVTATGAQAGPGSRRRNSPSDGVFLCGVLNAVPTQYVQFNDDGMTLVSPKKITLKAPEADVVTTGDINLQAGGKLAITATALSHNGVDVGFDHKHLKVQTGGGISGSPVGGPL